MPKFIIQYEMPYTHRVQVGIEAQTSEQAVAQAQTLFDDGALWDDTPDVPLLLDDFEEDYDSSVPLDFTVEAKLPKDQPWPDPDASVHCHRRRRDAALLSARLLLQAYERAETSHHIDWGDIDLAYKAALKTRP